MSSELAENFLPNPGCTRGRSFHLSTDPTGKYMVYPHGRTIVVREIEDPSKGYVVTAHALDTTCARFAPSGFYVASADVSGRLLIWDTTQAEHEVKYEYRPLSGKITDIQWSPDSKRIVVSGESGEKFCHAFLWDSGSSVGSMTGHSKICNAIDLKMTRPFRVATASDDRQVGFYQGPPFKLDKMSSNHGNFVNSVRFSPSGDFFISGSADGKIFIYDGKTGETIEEIKDGDKAHARGIYGLSWSHDSTKFASCSADASIKIWDAASKEVIGTFQFEDDVDHHQLAVLWVNDATILSVSLNGDINYLNPDDTSGPARVITGHHKAITALACVADTGVVHSASYDGRVCRYDVSSGTASRISAPFANSVVSMSATADGGIIASSVEDKFASLDADATTFNDAVSVESVPNGVANGGDVTIVACLKRVEVVGGEGIDVDFGAKCCAVNPSGTEVAIGGEDSKIHIYSVNGSSLAEKTVVDASGIVYAVAFSPDGKFLASGDAGRNVYVFATEDYSLKMDSWRYHTARINALAWDPTSRYVASGSLDTNVIVWDMEKERKRINIKGAHPQHAVTAIGWISPTAIISGGQDASLRIFNITFHQ